MMLRMGFAPPVDAPAPSVQDQAAVNVSFDPSPSGPTLCGFALPSLSWSVRFPGIPKFPPFPFPPTFNFFVGLNCDLSNPLSASFGFGGGRASQADPDQDPDATADL